MLALSKSLRYRAEALPLHLLQAVLARLPFQWVTRTGAALGVFAFALGLRRAQTLQQIEIAFGGAKSAHERVRIARGCYRHFGMMGFQFLMQASLTKREVWDWVRLDDLALLRETLQEGKGALLITGHLGNWELVGVGLNQEGIALSLYVGAQHNPHADAIINRARQDTGSETVHKGPNVKGILKALRANRAMAILADQHDTEKRYYVAFFGQPVSVAPGPALLARRTGAPMLFADCTRGEDGRYGFRAERVSVQPTDDEELDVLTITQGLFERLEACVRARPEQYFWMHRRFRPIPEQVELSPANRRFLRQRLPASALPPA